MKTKLIILGAVVAVVLGGWYFVSPGYAMMQLRDAAEEANEAELEKRIDFPAVRQSLKDDLEARMAAEISSGEAEGLEGFGAMLGMALIDPMIDGFVTPQSMARLVEDGTIGAPGSDAFGSMGGDASGDGQSPSQSPASVQPPEWEIARDGISGFTALPKSRENGAVDPRAPTLRFERDGLGWRLVQIEIPNE